MMIFHFATMMKTRSQMVMMLIWQIASLMIAANTTHEARCKTPIFLSICWWSCWIGCWHPPYGQGSLRLLLIHLAPKVPQVPGKGYFRYFTFSTNSNATSKYLERPKSDILVFLLWSTRIFLAARSLSLVNMRRVGGVMLIMTIMKIIFKGVWEGYMEDGDSYLWMTPLETRNSIPLATP